MDKRNQKTREQIVDALVRLLETQALDEIPLGLIAKEAGISRTSIYRNYDSRSDILEFYVDDWYAKALPETAAIQIPERMQRTATPKLYFAWLLTHFVQDKALQAVVTGRGGAAASLRLHEKLESIMLSVLRKDFGSRISLEDANTTTQVFAAGTIRVAAQHLTAGDEIDVDRLSRFLASLAARGIRVMGSRPREL